MDKIAEANSEIAANDVFSVEFVHVWNHRALKIFFFSFFFHNKSYILKSIFMAYFVIASIKRD